MQRDEHDDPPPNPDARLARRRVATVAVVAAMGSCLSIWVGLSLLQASKIRTSKAEVDRHLESLIELARSQHDSMLTVPLSSLPPVAQACQGKLDDLGANSILFVVRQERAGTLAALGAPDSVARSDTIVAVDPAGKLRSRAAEQPAGDLDSYVGVTMKTPPWRWGELAGRVVEWSAPARTARRVAVVLMREGGPPRMVTDMVFEGGKAGLHVRVLDRGGTRLCEGRSDAAITHVQGPAVFGSAMVDVAFGNAVESTPVVDLCGFNGGEATCAAARYQRSLF